VSIRGRMMLGLNFMAPSVVGVSVYLRMAGGKVPSIYGPSADEPWM